MGGMIFEPHVTDDTDVPYTVERFSAEPDCAREFLEKLETNSRNYLGNWRQWNDEEIRYEASYRLSLVEQDLIQVHYLREKDRLN